MKTARVLAATLAIGMPGAAALAQGVRTTTLGNAGIWTVFYGQAPTGTKDCAMSSSNRLGLTFAIRYFSIDPNGFSIRIFKKGWNIPNGTIVGLSIDFGNGRLWPLKGEGHGYMIDIPMPGSASDGMWQAIRTEGPFRIVFSGNEPALTSQAAGGNAAADMMLGCVRRLAATPPTQPFNAAPTQPFAAPAPGPGRQDGHPAPPPAPEQDDSHV